MIAPAQLQKLILKISVYDDAIAYKELFRLYYQKLLTFSTSILHLKEQAEEAVSDVFIKLWVNRASLTRIENFHLYIYIATKNVSLNYLSKQKKEKAFFLDGVQVNFNAVDYDPGQMLMTKEMHRRIVAAIAGLPPKCQFIFKLIKEDGLKYKEVAELLGLSVKTVENQMTIALKKIATSIQFVPAKKSLL